MSLVAPVLQLGVPKFRQGTFGAIAALPARAGTTSGLGSFAWPAANLAILIPIWLVEALPIGGLGLVNGATASGNWDVGIYDHTGRRLKSTGSVAQAGTNAVQRELFSAPHQLIGPGLFYLALAMDNTTGTSIGHNAIPAAERARIVYGAAEAAAAFPLPATITPDAFTRTVLPQILLERAEHHVSHRHVSLPSLHVWPGGMECVGLEALTGVNWFSTSGGGATASAAWPTANRAFYFPFVLTRRERFRTAFLYNGATVSGNFDIAVYDQGYQRLYTLSGVAQSGANAIQTVTLSPTWDIGPGIFVLGVSMDNTTGTVVRGNISEHRVLAAAGVGMQDSAYPLPTSITLSTITVAYVPMFGISTRSFI